jgi:hypothetical protein
MPARGAERRRQRVPEAHRYQSTVKWPSSDTARDSLTFGPHYRSVFLSRVVYAVRRNTGLPIVRECDSTFSTVNRVSSSTGDKNVVLGRRRHGGAALRAGERRLLHPLPGEEEYRKYDVGQVVTDISNALRPPTRRTTCNAMSVTDRFEGNPVTRPV